MKNKKLLTAIGLVAATTVAVGCVGVAGYAIADGVVNLPNTQTDTEIPLIKTIVTDSTITISPIEGAEYSLDGVIYQDSNIFTDLQPVTEYVIFVRIKATETDKASDPVTTRVTTDKATQLAPSIRLEALSGTSVRVTLLPNCEYSIDNGKTWTENSAFANLEENTTYTILARYKETATYHASEIAELQVTTNNATAGFYNDAGEIVYDWQTLKQYGYIKVENNVLTEVDFDSDQFGTLQLSDEVYEIGSYSMGFGASPLRKVIVPSSVHTIHTNAFDGMQYLETVILPPTINSIGGGAFSQTPALKTINLPNDITEIADRMFYNSGIEEIDIPDTVTRIGSSAFNSCNDLVDVTLPEGLVTIDAQAFFLTGLSNIDIPDTVETIGSQAFGMTNITNIELPSALYTFGQNAFRGSALQNYVIDSSNAYYEVIEGVLFAKQTGKLISYPCGRTETTYTIPSNTTAIGSLAFAGSNLQSIEIPSTVELIEDNAFANCQSLVTAIVNAGNVQNYVFSYCTNLQSVTFGENVGYINSYVFENCYNLETVTMLATTPPTLASELMLSGAQNKLSAIYIPSGSLNVYSSASNWSNYTELFEEI